MTNQLTNLQAINDEQMQAATGGEKLPYWLFMIPGPNLVLAPALIGQAIQEVVEG